MWISLTNKLYFGVTYSATLPNDIIEEILYNPKVIISFLLNGAGAIWVVTCYQNVNIILDLQAGYWVNCYFPYPTPAQVDGGFCFSSDYLWFILPNFLAKDSFELIPRVALWKNHVGWKLILTTCLNDYCKSKRGNNFQFLNTRWLSLITHKRRRIKEKNLELPGSPVVRI